MPANRLGSYTFTPAQLKVLAEVISLVEFSIFSVLWLRAELRWNYLAAFLCLVTAVFFVFHQWA